MEASKLPAVPSRNFSGLECGKRQASVSRRNRESQEKKPEERDYDPCGGVLVASGEASTPRRSAGAGRLISSELAEEEGQQQQLQTRTAMARWRHGISILFDSGRVKGVL
ncbi:hypothetical protein AXG93_2139s1210 [Marchantia polymorpha subsp. ruderalis]|uniref:Uncharacterized protein n=1 Tax=Marchantia polymorpha subsp. ruderalis TaxID=1480154 RepID=A0A176WK86_MARPO|nr:hypothetical protein AXG93_2139s1210 [Marchantia polymorpha subsp. ruderalis]